MMCEKTRLMEEPFSKPQHLHPAAVYFTLLKVIKETIFGLGVGLIIALKESVFYFILFASAFLTLFIIFSVLSWLRFTYRVVENELRIEQGIFIRKKRYISLNRIHKIDVTADVVHRLFKLVKVQIDTASSGEGAEVFLSAVKVADGEQLRKMLKKQQPTTENREQTEVLGPRKKIDWRRLFIAGTTSGSVGIILMALLAFYSQIEELLPENMYRTTYQWLLNQGIVLLLGVVVIFLSLLWLFGIAGTMIKYGNFTIEKRTNELFIKRGLLETKELTIPFDRIQAIGVEQSVIRQPFKFVQVFAVVAGGSFDKTEAFPVLFPILRENEVAGFLKEFIPDHNQVDIELTPLPKRGRKFYLFHATIWSLLLLLPIVYFFPSFGWLLFILLVLGISLGWFQHKDGGYAIRGQCMILRRRRVGIVTLITSRRRIQTLERRQHVLQASSKLATVELSLIGSGGGGTHYALRHVEEEDANQIADWYSYR